MQSVCEPIYQWYVHTDWLKKTLWISFNTFEQKQAEMGVGLIAV